MIKPQLTPAMLQALSALAQVGMEAITAQLAAAAVQYNAEQQAAQEAEQAVAETEEGPDPDDEFNACDHAEEHDPCESQHPDTLSGEESDND